MVEVIASLLNLYVQLGFSLFALHYLVYEERASKLTVVVA